LSFDSQRVLSQLGESEIEDLSFIVVNLANKPIIDVDVLGDQPAKISGLPRDLNGDWNISGILGT
jgi:hypothetical protein